MVERAKRLLNRAMSTLPGRVVQRLGKDGAANQAVLVAWNLLFSMFPIVLVLAGLVGLVLGHVGLASRGQIESSLVSQLPTDAGQTQTALATIKQKSGIFFVIGFVGLIWSGSALFGAMEQAFDAIFERPQRDFVHQKLMSILMMLLFAVLGVVIVLSSAAVGLLAQLPLVPQEWLAALGVVRAVQAVLSIAAACLLMLAIYKVVPNRPVPWAEAWPGALLAGFGFYVLSWLFPLYLHFAGSGMNQYGQSLTVLFVFMTWAYFIGVIIMLGAELNAVLAAQRAGPHPAKAPPRGPSQAEPAPRRRSRLYAVVGAVIGLFAMLRSGRRRAA